MLIAQKAKTVNQTYLLKEKNILTNWIYHSIQKTSQTETVLWNKNRAVLDHLFVVTWLENVKNLNHKSIIQRYFLNLEQSIYPLHGSQPSHGNCCCCQVASVVSDSVWPHRRQPTRLCRPWDSPSKNTGVGCHVLRQCMKVKRESEVAQSCPTLRDPMDCSPPSSSVHGIFQAREL